ncbi:MAG: glycoside hydrolase family 97 protein [Calditrichaeota bacterium]|nr:glycoside hydrolase family 97 protein [Calditrichota bacterium]HQU73015.1 glycoside hydrolase family 97 protein [Calditrichia bacterium]
MNRRCHLSLFFFFMLFLTAGTLLAQQNHRLESPDGRIALTIISGPEVRLTVSVDGREASTIDHIAMTLADGTVFGQNTGNATAANRQIRAEIKPVVPEKFAVIPDRCNELTLSFPGHYALVFRAYDNGIAWHFQTRISGNLTIASETASLRFPKGSAVYFPEEESFFSHNERTYLHQQLDTMSTGRLASLPLLVESGGPKLLLAESALRDYPGMWVRSGAGGRLDAVFPPYALESKPRPGSDRDVPVTRPADFIAQTDGKRDFPWRILAIAHTDADLITNQLVFQLGEPNRLTDTDWIRPGKVAWDWWNANNIYGVDFKSGVNTETYRYYIDFAAQYGIEYVILDEGWYQLGNLLDISPGMDIENLFAYGKEKGVGLILWVVWKTLDDQFEEALDQFQQWGAAGIKVDFMQRDDQEMVNYYWKVAEAAAKRRMLVDFHGAYKPAGLRRTFPNVISREGLKGLEHNKWSEDITPTHNLILPFIRMVPGPMDYTPGATVNAQPDNFRVIFSRPMSMTTRAHQAAIYAIYESPLQMLADNPSNYLKTPEFTGFVSRMPTTWEETRVLEASLGQYLVVARRHGEQWFLGGMTNEQGREFSLDLAFLGKGTWQAELLEDGVNADRFAEDFRISTRALKAGSTLQIILAPSGGFAAILSPHP